MLKARHFNNTLTHLPQNRQILREVSSNNEKWLLIIEAAAFVIYLDDFSPQDASERGRQFLHANGFNRWNDKTVQFAVCNNGVSAGIGEHAMLDGYVSRRLNKYVTAAIMGLEINGDPSPSGNSARLCRPPKSYTFTTTALLDQKISCVRARVLAETCKYDLAAFELSIVNENFFRSHKCPPKSGMQLLIQLACRRYFGYNPAADRKSVV